MPKQLPLKRPDNRPHYIFIYSCPSGCYTTMWNAVEPQNTESAAPYCPQRFSRKDPCERHIKKKHADLKNFLLWRMQENISVWDGSSPLWGTPWKRKTQAFQVLRLWKMFYQNSHLGASPTAFPSITTREWSKKGSRTREEETGEKS